MKLLIISSRPVNCSFLQAWCSEYKRWCCVKFRWETKKHGCHSKNGSVLAPRRAATLQTAHKHLAWNKPIGQLAHLDICLSILPCHSPTLITLHHAVKHAGLVRVFLLVRPMGRWILNSSETHHRRCWEQTWPSWAAKTLRLYLRIYFIDFQWNTVFASKSMHI